MNAKTKLTESEERVLERADLNAFATLNVPEAVTQEFARGLVRKHGRTGARLLVTAALQAVEDEIRAAETSAAR